MLLVLGSEDDRLTHEVHRRLVAGGSSVTRIAEPDLFAATKFSLTIDQTQRSGFIQCHEKMIPLKDITGILFRLPRVWWPSSEFDLQDQLFVYHETSSAWFCVLSGLTCPQINRFGLGWWVHDLTYLTQLQQGVAASLGMRPGNTPLTDPRPIRIFPTPTPKSQDSRHVYLIGDNVLPRTSCDRKIADRVNSEMRALTRWQHDTGIVFCRLDFEENDELELAHVEPMPMLDDDPADTISKVGEQLARRLS